MSVDGNPKLTFYASTRLVRAVDGLKAKHEFSAIMRSLAEAYFLGKSPIDSKRQDLGKKEEAIARLQHEVEILRAEIDLMERAVDDTRRLRESERLFRARVKERVGDPKIDWKDWCHDGREDVQTIGVGRAREIVEQEVGRRIW